MKIVFITTMTGDQWGGSEELWFRAAKELLKKDVAVEVAVPPHRESATQFSELRKLGCKVHALPSPFSRTWPQRIARKLHLGRLNHYPWLDKARPDLVVISMGSAEGGVLESGACQQRGLRYAFIIQAAIAAMWPSDEFADQLRKSYTNASTCWFVSSGNLRTVESHLGIRLSNASVIRNPFNLSYAASPAWPSDTEGTFKMACVGRLDVAKGQDLLIQVLALKQWQSRPLSLSLFGQGRLERGLKNLAKLVGLTNVTFCGQVENVEQIWATHHAFVQPSRWEGLPLSVVEAMLCGRTGLVTDVEGNAELIENNVTGFVALGPTIGAVDQSLELAWQRRDEWQSMGQLAAKRVRELVPPDPVGVFVQRLVGLANRAVV